MSVSQLLPDWPAPDTIVAGTTLRQADRQPGDLPAGLPGEPCWLRQVHGNTVVEVGQFDRPPAADAAVGFQRGDVCIVQTADCLPVLFCSPDGSVIAAVHAGWRGLAAGVLENAVTRMDVDASALMAWFGPAISQASFEVGEEVRLAFLAHDDAAASCFTLNPRGRWQADLYALGRQRLRAAGVVNIYGGGLCTYQDEARFFSYRRDPGGGRILTYIARL